ncbi:MAG: hypothetical protein JO060_02295, partial [Candidatus Eremiobacteraeota bacterium]|nr:hypothetical protein [Candidatus Eremiobacteraeota bacterium]
NYSGNFFWTTNVSLPRSRLEALGGFNETFREYGWEDIELGLRLRFAGTQSTFNPKALVYHLKPPLRARDVERMVRQARAQARTARELYRLHPHWRVVLATGDDPFNRAARRMARRIMPPEGLAERFAQRDPESILSRRQRRGARALATAAYYEELDAAHRTAAAR